MSNFTMERICCPKCKTEQNTKVWEEISADASPRAREGILNGDFFTYKCKRCGHEMHMTYNCIYHDMKKGIVIWLVPEINGEINQQLEDIVEKDMEKLEKRAIKESTAEKNFFRLVTTPNQLREKLIIAENHLDDKIVEIMKKIYLANLHTFFPEDNISKDDVKEILFDQDEEGKNSVVLFTEKYEPISLPVNEKMYNKVYEDFSEAVHSTDKEGFERVDDKWTEDYIIIEE